MGVRLQGMVDAGASSTRVGGRGVAAPVARPQGNSRAPVAAGPAPSTERGDLFDVPSALTLPPARHLFARARREQAQAFLRRADAVRRTMADTDLRTTLGAIAQTLAGRFTAPDAPVGAGALERFLDASTFLADVDVELLKEFLVLLRHFMEQGGPLAEFLVQVERTFVGLASVQVDGLNDFLSQASQSTGGIALSVRAAQFVFDVQTAVHGQQLNIHISVTQVSVEITQTTAEGDPLVLDLDGNGIELSAVDRGQVFDLNADGRADRTAFVTGGDGLLALDRNGNGIIDDGGELFGDQHGAANGFEELARFDDNGDGRITAQDEVYGALRVLGDFDGDGVVAPNELRTLAELEIAAIDLHAQDADEQASGGNRIAQRGTFLRTDGTRGAALDVLLRYRAT